ncbi:ribose-5-phosphate isomerase [Gigaspora rosea]|uniref:Ribose-5-phosphate isomerase n=1 Tax=Gigaspora rosea TaxID=44941 RepID=A0A397VMQ9_9GLOM|nr:ribose-5-phosphate isomerase [Gigaspora rosea]CAG8749602.1 26312_t:CDS:2 [Gigaspora rosea]
MSSTESKRQAAYKAVDTHLNSETRIIGIGSGSTVVFVIERIVQRGNFKKNDELNEKNESSDQKLEELDLDQCVFIPTSFQSRQLIINNGLNLGEIDQYQEIDITIDGADEVDENLNAIKGGGACHLREKVVAEISKKFIIVADYTKRSTVLGEKWVKGIPIEVIPFCYALAYNSLKLLGCQKLNLRMAKNKAGPVITDNGNFVIDAYFGKLDGQQSLGNDNFMFINSPSEVLKRIKLLTGVVEVGLFVGMAEIAYFGEEDGCSVGVLKK